MENLELDGNDNKLDQILNGNDNFTEANNVAEEFVAEYPDAKPKKRAGRKEGIDDGYLASTRNQLVGLLEGAWGEIGLALERVRTAADVRAAFLALDGCPSPPYIISALLRESEEPANPRKLRSLNIQGAKVNQRLSDAEQTRQQALSALEVANRVDTSNLPTAQQDLVLEEQTKRKADLDSIDLEYRAMRQVRAKLDEEIRNAQAYYSRAEFAWFCRQGRYAFTPLNVANAMAGLPYIGYRQSVKRCRQWKLESGSGGGYQVFLVLRSIVNSRKGRMKLSEHAEQWLRARHQPEANAIRELREKWYYLRRSLVAVAKTKPHPRWVPYLLATEYYRRLKHRTSVDLLFEEGERITP